MGTHAICIGIFLLGIPITVAPQELRPFDPRVVETILEATKQESNTTRDTILPLASIVARMLTASGCNFDVEYRPPSYEFTEIHSSGGNCLGSLRSRDDQVLPPATVQIKPHNDLSGWAQLTIKVNGRTGLVIAPSGMNTATVERYYGFDPNVVSTVIDFYDNHLTEQDLNNREVRDLCKSLSDRYFKEWMDWKSFRAVMYSYFFETVVAKSEECF